MAVTNYLSYAGLSKYDELIKSYIGTEDAKSIRSLAVVGDTIYFFKTVEVPTVTTEGGEVVVDTSKAAYHVDIASSDVETLKTDVSNLKTKVGTAVLDTEAKDLSGAVNELNTAIGEVASDVASLDTDDIAATFRETGTTLTDALGKIDTDLSAAETAIETLNGDATKAGSVAKSIKDAIDKLDKEDSAVAHQFVTAVSEEDGVITVSRAALTADDIPTLTLEKISDAGTAAAADIATTAIAEDSSDASLVSAAQVAKFVKDEVADLSGAMHFRGIFESLDDVTDPKAGDVAIVGVKEYVYGGDPATWKELGDESVYVTKTTTIAGVDLQNDITKDEMLTALNVADGAQVNVLEGVQVNGVDLTADGDKKVNVTIAEGTINGSIKVNGTDVSVHGLGSAAFTDADAYDEAGAAEAVQGDTTATVKDIEDKVNDIGTIPLTGPDSVAKLFEA